MTAMSKKIRKAVLAYSGGLDTSVILLWLRETYGCEVATFTADIGQGEEIEPARAKAEQCGASSVHLEDLREEFVRDYVWPMFRANAVYEHDYLLGTAVARPLIAKRQAEIALEIGADAVAHGATGKGNDQVRFELGYFAHAPGVQIIAPWREWDLNSRSKTAGLRRRPRHSGGAKARARSALQHGRESAAYFLRRRRVGGSDDSALARHVAADCFAGRRTRRRGGH